MTAVKPAAPIHSLEHAWTVRVHDGGIHRELTANFLRLDAVRHVAACGHGRTEKKRRIRLCLRSVVWNTTYFRAMSFHNVFFPNLTPVFVPQPAVQNQLLTTYSNHSLRPFNLTIFGCPGEPTSVSSLLDKNTIQLCIAGTHLCNIRVQNKKWSFWIFVVAEPHSTCKGWNLMFGLLFWNERKGEPVIL